MSLIRCQIKKHGGRWWLGAVWLGSGGVRSVSFASFDLAVRAYGYFMHELLGKAKRRAE